MLNSQRIFVDAIKRYCAGRGIALELRAEGWLLVMRRGEKRLLAFGYDLGLNSAVAHRIANDKSATADVLAMSGVSCVPHALFMNPRHNAPVPPRGSWETMLALLKRHAADGVRRHGRQMRLSRLDKACARACGEPDFFDACEPFDLALP